MILTGLKYYKFSGNLSKPIKTSKGLITNKQGFIIRISNETGLYGYGEISPLENFSKESLNEVEEGLRNIKLLIDCRNELSDILNRVALWNIPSLLFGFEQAANNIAARELQAERSSEIHIPVNYLVSFSSEEEQLKNINYAYSQGWRTVKLKMGIKQFEKELNFIAKISELYPDLKMRLDLNGSWSIDEAREKIFRLSEYNIEYIEQPVEGLQELIELSRQTNIQLAPDESINTFNDALLVLEHPYINFIVIKPMSIGFENSISIISMANLKGKNVIISTMFESFVGLSGLLHLATLVNHKYSHGIGSYLNIDSETLSYKYAPSNGFITYERDLDFKNINTLFED